jgi:hypothetical protein
MQICSLPPKPLGHIAGVREDGIEPPMPEDEGFTGPLHHQVLSR